jgi:phage protein D
MPQQKFLSEHLIKINGQDAPHEFMNDLLETIVDTSLYLPEMFTILVKDSELKWVDEGLLDLGNSVEISVAGAEQVGGHGGLLIKGEITALEPDFSGEGKTNLLVRGYNKSHRLHRGKKSRTFLKMTDSAVVSKIAGEVGLSADMDATNVTYDYIIQSNQTNMEFLQERAGRIGYQAFAAEDKLYFKKGEANLGDGPELKFAEDLRSFRPALAATHQVDKIKVLGWDAKQKKAITAQASPNGAMNQGGIGKTGGAVAATAFGGAETVLVNQPVSTPDEAKALADGLANDLSSEFIQAEGVCLGNPGVKAGYVIKISGI